MKVAFVTNICAHYRVKTFELLAHYHELEYYFFSAGDDWYWQQEHGIRVGDFNYEYLPGFRFSGTRVTPTLPWKLWKSNYDVYIKCINGRFALPVTYIISKIKRKPFILWTGIWMRLQTLTHRLIFPFTRHIYHRADAIVVYGKHVKQYLISEGVPEERIFIAAHAVENEAYRHKISRGEKEDLLRELGIQPDQKVILYLGRLEEDKGLSYLLEAFASLSRDDTVLLLAGTGTKRERLIQLARNKGILNHVRFPGYIDPDKTVFYYALAYVFVLPSITMPFGKEPWGLVINEAMNQGVPVIATESVGAAAGGLVKNGENGFVIPERDSNALSHTLSVCLNNAALRDRLGNNAKEDIKYWDNKRMVKGFRNAIEYTMNRK